MYISRYLPVLLAMSVLFAGVLTPNVFAEEGKGWGAKKKTDAEVKEYLDKAREAMQANDYELALGFVDQAISLQPDKEKLYRLKAICYFDSGKIDAGLAALDRAIELDPDNFYTYLFKSGNLSLYDRYEELLAWTDVMLERFPDNCISYQEKSFALMSMRRYEDQAEFLEDSLKKVPQCSNLVQDAALALMELGRADEAIPLLEHAAEHDHDGNLNLFLLGSAYEKDGQYDKAIEAYEKAGEARPEYKPTSVCRIAEVLALKGKVSDAIALIDAELSRIRKLPETEPGDFEGYLGNPVVDLLDTKAGILVTADRYYEAMAAYDELGELDDGYGCDLCYKVPLLTALGNYDEALAVIDSSDDKDGEFTVEMRLWVLIEMGELKDALAYIEDAVKKDPSSGGMRRDYGYALLFAERYTDAIVALDKALELDDHDGEAIIYKAYALMQRDGKGDYEAAEKMLKAMADAPGFDYYEEMASAYALLGDKEKMLKELRSRVDNDPITAIFIKSSPEFGAYLSDPDFMDVVGK